MVEYFHWLLYHFVSVNNTDKHESLQKQSPQILCVSHNNYFVGLTQRIKNNKKDIYLKSEIYLKSDKFDYEIFHNNSTPYNRVNARVIPPFI